MSDKKSALAVSATGYLNDIILERYLIDIIPKNRQYSIKTIKEITGYNLSPIRNYVRSNLFTIHKKAIEITDNKQLLDKESKFYCEKIIKKLVFTSKYEHNEFIYYIGKLFNNSYYTSEENRFINLMLEKLLCLINDDITLNMVSHNKVLKINLIYSDGFYYVARDIFNAIIHNKLHAGDSIMPYMSHNLMNKNTIPEKLESSSTFDCFFNENAILKCDLNTNINILIKNFLNLSIYNIYDATTRAILMLKLNSKLCF